MPHLYKSKTSFFATSSYFPPDKPVLLRAVVINHSTRSQTPEHI